MNEIISVLIAILLLALNKARESARRVACGSYLRQLVLATHAYAADYKRYPSLVDYPRGATGTSWSVHAKLLPYLGMKDVASRIGLDRPFANDPEVTQRRIGVFLCPSEPNDAPRPDGALVHYPTSYGACAGSWLVFDPVSATATANGAFVPNQALSPSAFKDPASETVAFAEAKVFGPYLRDGGNPSGGGAAPPASSAVAVGYGGSFRIDSGHSAWVDGNVHLTGVTTTFPPNTRVAYSAGGATYDVDFTSSREGRSTNQPTYAAVTARSHHGKVANAAMIDRSVQAVPNDIPVERWRAMGTRAGRD